MPPLTTKSKTIGIVGSRRRVSDEDFRLLVAAIDGVYRPGDRFVSGGCAKGADDWAYVLAREMGVTMIIHFPRFADLDEALLATNVRAAYAEINYARNTLIAQDSDILIALVAPDRTGGTEDTVKKALKLGRKVIYA